MVITSPNSHCFTCYYKSTICYSDGFVTYPIIDLHHITKITNAPNAVHVLACRNKATPHCFSISISVGTIYEGYTKKFYIVLKNLTMNNTIWGLQNYDQKLLLLQKDLYSTIWVVVIFNESISSMKQFIVDVIYGIAS